MLGKKSPILQRILRKGTTRIVYGNDRLGRSLSTDPCGSISAREERGYWIGCMLAFSRMPEGGAVFAGSHRL